MKSLARPWNRAHICHYLSVYMVTSRSLQHHKVCGQVWPLNNILTSDFPDPVFFLHHTQLDRLWWNWQEADPAKRLQDYTGRTVSNSTEKAAKLADSLSYGDLGPTVKVSEIMNTRTGPLCYVY